MLLKLGSNIKIDILWLHILSNACKKKKKEEKLIGFVVSFKPQILSTWDQKNPPLLNYYEQFEMPTTLKHLDNLKR
jgi:acyl carrier protein phosphodiesterase